jgi:hypothetical protein
LMTLTISPWGILVRRSPRPQWTLNRAMPMAPPRRTYRLLIKLIRSMQLCKIRSNQPLSKSIPSLWKRSRH